MIGLFSNQSFSTLDEKDDTRGSELFGEPSKVERW